MLTIFSYRAIVIVMVMVLSDLFSSFFDELYSTENQWKYGGGWGEGYIVRVTRAHKLPTPYLETPYNFLNS